MLGCTMEKRRRVICNWARGREGGKAGGRREEKSKAKKVLVVFFHLLMVDFLFLF